MSLSFVCRPLASTILVLSVDLVGGPGLWVDRPAARLMAVQGAQEAGLVVRQESAAAQLRVAVGLKLEMRGKYGPERERLREQAVEAYRAVRRFWAREPELCAESAFRAGELLRAGRRESEALVEFRVARGISARSVFASRAGLEIGHIRRRSGRRAQALDVYLDLIAASTTAAPQRDDALLWAGRVYASEGRLDDAKRLWIRLSHSAQDPVDRVAGYDEWALLAIDSGDLEAAAGVLERCRKACADVLLEETTRGRRMRRAIASMRCPGRLERAIEARRRGVVIDTGR